MAEPWSIQVFERQQLVYADQFEGPIEMGRQGELTEAVYSRRREGQYWRVVIAGRDEDSVSRRHALLEPKAGGSAVLTNLSAKVPIRLPDGADIEPRQSRELLLPAFLLLGRKTVRVQAVEPPEADGQVECLREATIAPGALLGGGLGLNTPMTGMTFSGMPHGSDDEMESMVRWLNSTLGVFQSATDPAEFYQIAARAAVENVGLDSGQVLMREDGQWVMKTSTSATNLTAGDVEAASRSILNKVLEQRRTFWRLPGQLLSGITNLKATVMVVAAPILNRHGEVIGAIYGDRKFRSVNQPPTDAKVDALLVELIAGGVAAGLSRVEQERAAIAAKVQFEQFFTPELAHVLAARPQLLQGQDAEISVLFCDIRGFSRISEQLTPAKVFEWIGDVMTELSACVRNHQGVLVDYVGDGLMAMWGAPSEQPEHARMACAAALEMLDRVPVINERWKATLGEPMGLGIGINTGDARVGNTGSTHKFKYGPLGNTVNLASRIEGVTKHLKSRLLISGVTHARLGNGMPSRRIGKVKVVNIVDPVELYELVPSADPKWDRLREGYQSALAEFEFREFRKAARILGPMILEHPDDGPSVVLLSRVVNCLIEPDAFDPSYVPPGK